MNEIRKSLAAGFECLSAWADLLDRINVFPVADGDTGTNLRISLTPLRDCREDSSVTAAMLARCATGNSGNIAAPFFQEFCRADSLSDLAKKADLGRTRARMAVAVPREGTMLTVFDRLAAVLADADAPQTIHSRVSAELRQAVLDSTTLLPELVQAGVVDSGALAMYIYFDCFFNELSGIKNSPAPILDNFAGKLAINDAFSPEATRSHCVDVILRPHEGSAADKSRFAGMGESVVVVEDESSLKVHIHTPEPEELRGQIGSLGEILHWSNEEIDQSTMRTSSHAAEKQPMHIITDAAGSLTKEMARGSGITLLDSYIVIGEDSNPESLCIPEQIYERMRCGERVTTAQASLYERHRHYESACQQFGDCLYLCVGSAFTGNYDSAVNWKREYDQQNRLTIVDTGAASGRLGLIALLTARFARQARNAKEVIGFARTLTSDCAEYVFINELKYLVAGGRMSKTSGLFGDLLHMKPVISPTSEGVKKEGVVHSSKGQIAFALTKLRERFEVSASPVIMLQFSDNREWLVDKVRNKVHELLPNAEILVSPLSLTSGVHMGPGTWSMAIAPPLPPVREEHEVLP